MDFGQLVVTLLLGLALGGLVVWVVLRGRERVLRDEVARAARDLVAAQADAEGQRGLVGRVQQQVDAARGEAQQAALRIEGARTQVAEAECRVAEARAEAAEARAEASAVRENHAELAARVGQAEAERDAARRQAAEVIADRERMTVEFKNTSSELLELQGRRADEVAEKRMLATDQALKPVTEALMLFHERLNQVEKERVAMSRDLQAHVQTVRATGDDLRRETASLVTALRQPHVRGAWGEMQLRRVAEVAGMLERCDFDLQVSGSTDDGLLRPDMRVNLAGGKFVYVDAKVPLAAFLDAQEATDERDRAEALVRFGKNLKTHIDQLSSKQYWTLDAASPEFVVMFLASDAFLHAGVEQMPNLHEYAAARNVVIATPAILIATLRAIAYGWKQSALADSAAEVFSLGRELYERLSTMGGHFDKLGRQLGSAVKHYNSTVASLESRVLVSARRLKDLNVSDDELVAPSQQETIVRTIAAPELLAGQDEVAELVERGDGVAMLPSVSAGPGLPADALTDGAADERAHTGNADDVAAGELRTPTAPGLPEVDELTRPEPDGDDLFADADADTVSPPIRLAWRRATMGR